MERTHYDIKPKPTLYKGVHLRSRLEAKWAMFFDRMEMPWWYEPWRFETPAGVYIPDFFLPEQDLFVEVKPECREHLRLAHVINMLGRPARGTVMGAFPKTAEDVEEQMQDYGDYCWGIRKPTNFEVSAAQSDGPYAWCVCPECRRCGFEFAGRAERISHKPGCMQDVEEKCYRSDDPAILEAFTETSRFRDWKDSDAFR